MDALIKMHACLKRGGFLYVKTPNMANPFVNTAGRYIDFTHEVGFTEKSLRQVIEAAGYGRVCIYGTDIYVFNPIVSVPARIIAKMTTYFLWLFSALFGRTGLRIFEKDVLAVARR